jgi:hypothetical protein
LHWIDDKKKEENVSTSIPNKGVDNETAWVLRTVLIRLPVRIRYRTATRPSSTAAED